MYQLRVPGTETIGRDLIQRDIGPGQVTALVADIPDFEHQPRLQLVLQVDVRLIRRRRLLLRIEERDRQVWSFSDSNRPEPVAQRFARVCRKPISQAEGTLRDGLSDDEAGLR